VVVLQMTWQSISWPPRPSSLSADCSVCHSAPAPPPPSRRLCCQRSRRATFVREVAQATTCDADEGTFPRTTVSLFVLLLMRSLYAGVGCSGVPPGH
jgi:hypothetical protein